MKEIQILELLKEINRKLDMLLEVKSHSKKSLQKGKEE